MKQRFTLLGLVCLVLGYLLIGLIKLPAHATAATLSGRWIDAAHIKIADKSYTDTNIDDNGDGGSPWALGVGEKNEYYLDGDTSSGTGHCKDVVKDISSAFTTARLYHRSFVAGSRSGGTCNEISHVSVGLSSTSLADVEFKFIDSTHVQRVDGKISYTSSGVTDTGFINYMEDKGSCSGVVQITKASLNTTGIAYDIGILGTSTSQTQGNGTRSGGTTSCVADTWAGGNLKGRNIKIGNFAASTATTDTGETAGGTISDSCDSKGGVLAWVICPVIKILDGVTSTIDTDIRSQLETGNPMGSCRISEDANNPDCNLYKAWGRLRNIALAMLVPILLVMVVGTALGFSFVDAYTVKRALPRFLIAIIFISVSWYITLFLIQLTNVVGRGVLGLMTQPFGLSDKSLADLVSAHSGFASGFVIVGGVIAALGGSLAMGIAFSLALVAAVVLFTAFLVLVMRQVAIIGLMLLAPLAILGWIFPNNDRVWKLWWGTFSKLLLMFPLIMALIAAGRIGASVIPGQQGSNSLFTQLLVITAYITPYFFIPATFKFAGGAFANLVGFVNDRSRGFFDKQREGRAKQREILRQNAITGTRFNPTNPFIQKFSGSKNKYVRRLNPNRLAEWSNNPYKSAAYYSRDRNIPFLSTRGRRLRGEVEHEMMEQSRKYAQHVNTYLNDKGSAAIGGMYDSFRPETQEELVRAGMATWGTDENGNRKILANGALVSYKDHMKMADILANSSSDSEKKAAEGLRSVAAWTEAQYRNPEMNYMNTAVGAAMHRASHGFFDGRDAEAVGRVLEGQGLHTNDVAAAVTQAELIGKDGHPENKPGYGHWIDSDGHIRDGLSADSDRGFAVAGTLDAGTMGRQKGGILGMTDYNDDGTVKKAGRFGDVVKDIIMSDKKDPSKRAAVVDRWRKALVKSDEYKKRDASGRRTGEVDTAKVQAAIDERLDLADRSRRGMIQSLKANANPNFSYANADVQRESAAILEDKDVGLGDLVRMDPTPEELAETKRSFAAADEVVQADRARAAAEAARAGGADRLAPPEPPGGGGRLGGPPPL